MAFQIPPTYNEGFLTSSNPTFVVTPESRSTTLNYDSPKPRIIRNTPTGYQVIVGRPRSPSITTNNWTLDTPENDEDDEGDLSWNESDSISWNSEDDCEESNDQAFEEQSEDEDEIMADANSDDSSIIDEDNFFTSEEEEEEEEEGYYSEISEDDLENLSRDRWGKTVNIPISYIVSAASLPGVIAAHQKKVRKATQKQGKPTKNVSAQIHREESQVIIEAMCDDISFLSSKVTELTRGNSALKEKREATEHALLKATRRNKRSPNFLKELYQTSLNKSKYLRQQIDCLNSRIDELASENSALRHSLEPAQSALDEEKELSREQ